MAWVRYKNQLQQKKAREHIVQVQHLKAQNMIGKGSLRQNNWQTFQFFLTKVSQMLQLLVPFLEMQ